MRKKISSVLAILPLIAITITKPADWFIEKGDNTFKALIEFIINGILLPIVGLIAVLFIIIGGFQYITSRGDEELAAAGKKTLTNAIIGLVIVILAYVIVAVTINALEGRV